VSLAGTASDYSRGVRTPAAPSKGPCFGLINPFSPTGVQWASARKTAIFSEFATCVSNEMAIASSVACRHGKRLLPWR